MLHIVVALLQAAAAVSPGGPSEVSARPIPAAVFNGRASSLNVSAPRLAEKVVVDGRLDEAAWQRAIILTGFSTYNPVDGRAAQDSTEVRLWYSSDAIYVGIRAWALPGTVRATLAERDHIQNDDWIALHLDTFNDHRRSFVFAVNPLGVQADGMRSEQSPGPGISKSSLQAVDLSQDYVWQSAGHVLEDGYEVEIRIPFKSIRFQTGSLQDWGLQIVRQTQRTGYQDTWTPTSKSNQSFLAQEGFLRGMKGMERGLVLDLTPSFTTIASGTPISDRWHYGVRNDAGGDIRWGVTPNFTLNATANPDFSQIETDVGQIPGDVRFANFYPELRPFFLEGSEQFDAPNKLVNMRSIVQPIGAIKLTGKIPRTDIGVLSAIDGASSSIDGKSNPMFNIVRLRRDIGDQGTAGLLFTDRTAGGRFNRVAGFDTRLQFAKFYSAEFRLAGSITRDDSTRRGALWEINQGRSGRSYGNRFSLQGFSPGFETQSGFVNRVDFVKGQINQRLTSFGTKGSWWDQRQHFLTGTTLWTYDDFTRRRAPLETQLTLDNSLQLRGGWRVSVTPDLQRTAFDERRYANLYTVPKSGRDTTVFTTGVAQNTMNVALRVNTPQWRTVGATIAVTAGTKPEFFETATVRRRDVEATVDLRPTPQVRVGTLFLYQRFVRDRDGTEFSSQIVPRLRLEYQFSRALFLRFVGQLESRERSALRDPRTEQALLRRNTDGTYALQGATKSLLGRVDWLVSYLPSPGTVAYFGYGSGLDASETMRPGELKRTSDGAFVKFSYLYRVGARR